MELIKSILEIKSLVVFVTSGLVSCISIFRKYLSSNEVKSILGTWYGINLTIKKDSEEVVCYEWNIYIHWSTFALKIKGSSLIDGKIGYTGKVIQKEGYIYVVATGQHAVENIMLILEPVFPVEESGQMKGAGIGLTYINKIAARNVIFQRERPEIAKLEHYKPMLDICKY